MAVRKTKSAKPVGTPSGFCAYVGPSIRGVIQHGTLYAGTKQQVLQSPVVWRATDKFEVIASLIVPGGEIMTAKKKINTPGNWLYLQKEKLMAQVTKEEEQT